MKVAGIGFRAAATLADLRAALDLTGLQVDALASITEKTQMPALRQLAQELQLPLLALAETDIAGEQTLSCSARIKARFATGSLAEACALVAARQGGAGQIPTGQIAASEAKTGAAPVRSRLIAPRVVTADGMATAAIAERLEP